MDVTNENRTMFYTNAIFKCTPLQRIATAALGHNNQVNYSLIRHADYVWSMTEVNADAI